MLTPNQDLAWRQAKAELRRAHTIMLLPEPRVRQALEAMLTFIWLAESAFRV